MANAVLQSHMGGDNPWNPNVAGYMELIINIHKLHYLLDTVRMKAPVASRDLIAAVRPLL